jgi:hypothetical protein
MARDKKLTYLGGGFLIGVPARDLTSDEVKRYGLDRLISSGLYRDNYKPDYQEDIEVLGDELEAIEDIFEED